MKTMMKFVLRNHLLVFTILLAFMPGASAQFYYINFEGTGAVTFLDSIKVRNNTQQTSLTMNGSDILFLYGTVGSSEPFNSMDGELSLFPNPAGNTSRLKFPVSEAGDHVISVSNVSGELITRSMVTLDKGIHEFEISGLRTGFYHLQLFSGNMKLGSKLVITGSVNGSPTIKHITDNPVNHEEFLKSDRGVVEMQYNTDDLLLFTCYAGNYTVVIPLVAIQSETIAAQFVPCTDGQGNHYPVVHIGSQTWMARNLETTKYSDGTNIPQVLNDIAWMNYTTGAYCWYGNNVLNKWIYGALYNWYATNPATNGNKNLCPEGWRVPDDVDYDELHEFIGYSLNAGGKLKETGNVHWNSPNTGATNEYGFTALPGGFRFTGPFSEIGKLCALWTTEEHSFPEYVVLRHVRYETSQFGGGVTYRASGLSVRCIKNQ